MSEFERKRVLIVDDDPSHLEIYGMIVDRAGYAPVLVIVRFAGPEPIPDKDIAAILLDYRLNSVATAPEIAAKLKARHPETPIIVLSDLWTLPADMEPYAAAFVRKGDPNNLVNTLQKFIDLPSTVAPAHRDS